MSRRFLIFLPFFASVLTPIGAWTASTSANLPVNITASVDPPSACIAQTYTYNLVTDFGAVSGGSVATNNAALQAFNVEAQRRTRPTEPGYAGGANGAGNPYSGASKDNCIVLNVPAGTYQYSWNKFGNYIGHLKIVGAGSGLLGGSVSAMQNTNSDGAYEDEQAFYHNDYIGSGAATNLGYFIKTANAGVTSVTLSGSASNTSIFYIGRWVLIASYDQMFSGYPPYFRYFDWAKVTSINTSTGVITFDTPTQFNHLANRPYIGTLTDGPSGTVGPARIIPIDTPAVPVGVYHEYDGLHVLANPNWNLAAQVSNDCWGISGLIDGAANDLHDDQSMCFNQARNFTISNSQWQEDELDKIINALTFNNDNVTGGSFSHAGELLWQVNGGHIGGNSNAYNGNTLLAMNANYQGVLIDAMLQTCSDFVTGVFLDTTLGYTSNVTLNNVTFKGNNCTNNFAITAPNRTQLTQTVDGRVVQSVAGPNGPETRLQIQRNVGTYGSPSYVVCTQFGEGSSIWKNGSLVSGATIIAITGDANNIYMDVTGTTFATGDTFWGPRVESISVTNSVGQTTGFTWASPNIHYPGGISIPNLTWTNNSGN